MPKPTEKDKAAKKPSSKPAPKTKSVRKTAEELYTPEERKSLYQIGRRVAELRARRHITQAQLAQLSGLHLSYIALIELGKRNMHVLAMIKLSKAHQVTLSELVKTEGLF
jgi:DNA-binding XRE family transcriptional regulator